MQLAKHVKFREEQFGGVLFETQSEKVFTLNEGAAAIVRELPKGGDAHAIAARLKSRYQDPSATIEADVAALLDDLHRRGLITETAA
ncbi:pyrroloquinoline quinone biosynthesis protein D [Acidiphilium sp. MT5]